MFHGERHTRGPRPSACSRCVGRRRPPVPTSLARSALDGKEAASRSLRFGASGESVPVSFKKLIADVRSAALTPSSVPLRVAAWGWSRPRASSVRRCQAKISYSAPGQGAARVRRAVGAKCGCRIETTESRDEQQDSALVGHNSAAASYRSRTRQGRCSIHLLVAGTLPSYVGLQLRCR